MAVIENCNVCFPSELIYEIRVEGHENLDVLSSSRTYIEKSKLNVIIKSNHLFIKEVDVSDIIDFFEDQMDLDKINFRINGQSWQPFSEIRSLLETQWLDDIIIKQSVVCYAQPIVDVNENVYSFEILSRFINREGNLLNPGDVFSTARKRKRLYALDRLCRMTAVRASASLQKKVFINFIPTSIYSPEHCLKSTVELARMLGVDPSNIVFEVVETEKVDDLNHLKRILKYYKDKGFLYALDDVGEGFSTLDVLEEITPNFMKLDIKYVQGVATSKEKQDIARVLLAAANKIHAIPLAEGIEDREDFEWLKKAGYQLFQGYLFGKPERIINEATQMLIDH